ncbi:N-acetyl-alpha-D-glucosaminyl L-malate synthase BshA [Phosphitispora sp. TUW77]|uniref:N-acetyl-alpha-D-glucosaminyl L-malate synthase BshA n=1 Tax=Phosphitispora sp. TUW77 TaxID=3152361 RepID=UPI003AB74987
MRIGIVCYPTYGGSGVVATELGKALAQKGHEIHFISYDRPFKLDMFHDNIFYHEVEVLDYPLFKFPPYMIALASKIGEVARWANLDLVHVHYAIPHAVSALLARKLVTNKYLPVVTTLHGTDITVVGHEPQFFDITKMSIEESDAVTAVSNSLKTETIELFNISKEIEVIYNFIDLEQYRRLAVPGLKLKYSEPGEKILIHISNFRAVKRLKDVIDIFAQVNKKIPGRLLMVGDGPETQAAHKQVMTLGLGDRVHFLGKQEQVVELLSISDLCLLPSEKESFGLVALEAMACGVPVVASLEGGLPEVLKEGVTGFMLPVGEVELMALKAVEVLSSPERWGEMSENAQKHANDAFRMEKIRQQYEDIYMKVLLSQQP